MDEQRDEVQISKEGIKIAGKDVNLIVLVLIAIGVGIGVYMTYVHSAEQKANSGEFVTAVRELTNAVREGNCLQSKIDPETCRRLAR